MRRRGPHPSRQLREEYGEDLYDSDAADARDADDPDTDELPVLDPLRIDDMDDDADEDADDNADREALPAR
ncbi:MAG: hypothetical protein ABI746_11185 [Dermatophilaceae bacterium]